MSRTVRIAPGGMVFHVLNRANNRAPIFEKDENYLAFLRVMRDIKKRSRCASYRLVCCQITGICFFGRSKTDNWERSCRRSRQRTSAVGGSIGRVSGKAICIKERISRFPCRTTSIFILFAATWNATRCERSWLVAQKIGVGERCGNVVNAGYQRIFRRCTRSRSRARVTGRRWSIARRQRQNWRLCGLRSAGPPLRLRVLPATHGCSTRTRIDIPRSRQTEEGNTE